MPLIVIGARAQYETRVSFEDYAYLLGFKWTFARSHKGGELIYARRSVWCPARRCNVTVLMHHVVMERAELLRPTPEHTADHENGDSLDNERENLRWLTPEQQMRNRRGVCNRPLERPMWDEDIPY